MDAEAMSDFRLWLRQRDTLKKSVARHATYQIAQDIGARK
jgi:hypothetical protein